MCVFYLDLLTKLFRYISKLVYNLLLVMIKAPLLIGSCPRACSSRTNVTGVAPGSARRDGWGGGLPRARSVADWRALLDSEKKEPVSDVVETGQDEKSGPVGFWNIVAWLDHYYSMVIEASRYNWQENYSCWCNTQSLGPRVQLPLACFFLCRQMMWGDPVLRLWELPKCLGVSLFQK